LDELNLTLAEQPSFLDARVRLGAVLQRLGRVDEATMEWRRCLEIDPTDRRARAYLVSTGITLEEVEVPHPSGRRGNANA
ncbi:MAG: tetratricopeptide repeat protein, partial [Gemmatimonadota bacterium]